jgi:hypothetical protein
VVTIAFTTLADGGPPDIPFVVARSHAQELRWAIAAVGLWLSRGAPPADSLLLDVGDLQEDVGEKGGVWHPLRRERSAVLRLLAFFTFELHPVSTYHYESLHHIESDKEFFEMFLSGALLSVFVGVMYESDAFERTVDELIADHIFVSLIKAVSR